MEWDGGGAYVDREEAHGRGGRKCVDEVGCERETRKGALGRGGRQRVREERRGA